MRLSDLLPNLPWLGLPLPRGLFQKKYKVVADFTSGSKSSPSKLVPFTVSTLADGYLKAYTHLLHLQKEEPDLIIAYVGSEAGEPSPPLGDNFEEVRRMLYDLGAI